MKISDVRASVHRFETRLPLIHNRPAGDPMRVCCEVETDEGHIGVGMSARFLCHGVAACVNHHLRPALVGMDPRNLEAIHARLQPIVSERGQASGINLAALSCVDLGLWDLIGKAAGRSVAQLLGGHRDHADVYVTFGFGAYDRDQLVAVARDLIARGHSRLKMLVGVAPGGIREDAERVRHLREALGEDVLIAIDANESLGLEDALQLARMLEDCGIAWFEDPLHRNDPRDMRLLRQRTSIPLSAGQMDGHSERFRHFLEHDAIDIFMPNSLFNGGMTETRRVAHLAQIYNRPLSDAGGGGIYCLHHVAGFRNGTLAEVHLGVEQVERQVFEHAPEAVNGRMHVPDAPGFGVTVDRDALKDSLVRGDD
ncbi:mandelate racemase/muconate lactonizing enzyme family protein [Sediminicurvatus halobius]|uniref:Mandelate racemase/muconate lactonizing enzyme family protein n=1 Tax=Sediminicurvatus halobius TaxID=2182432 RepID=A0A2U2N169_9GAMM|nr:mandelate racemase/muconate lactonizing enzyme family protein [Spiribacter halobius]PWG62729.1 mandelate racemase/muconate lactonizing enzyme family protein [Spiribacter halobius]UEX77398.1 mandelate racemase/muconate lactonizing enzyme family protein [Spiribacter halobius]